MSMSRQNQWFVPGTGIAREVITADIQRYLGPNALVRPGDGTGEHQGQKGYWITAYRTLTTPMIEDLKLDSQRWHQERQPNESGRGGGGVGGGAGSDISYSNSRTHASRQHWGPSEPYDQQHAGNAYADSHRDPSIPSRSAHATPTSYASNEPYYTTTPTPQHSTSGYPARDVSTIPRTQTTEQFPPYQHPGRQDPRDPRDYNNQHGYAYQGQAPANTYSRAPAPASTPYAASSLTAAPGYYIASDGNQYPIPQQQAPTSRYQR